MKRFYKQALPVVVEGGHGVTLDDRPVRTPARALLAVPTPALADAIAGEWNDQSDFIDPRAMPLTGLANAAIDRIAPDAVAFSASLARYAESDLLAYRADGPVDLVRRQAGVYDPLLAWARSRYDVGFELIIGISHRPQPRQTLERIRAAYATLDAFRLAALHPIVTITGSAVVGLAVLAGEIGHEAAYMAGQLEELWQLEHWGEDPIAEAGLADRRRALESAARFLSLLGPPVGRAA